MFTGVISSYWICPFIIVKCPSLSLVVTFVLKVYFVWYKYATPAFFPFAGNIFFHSFTFSLCASFNLKWAFYRKRMYGCFVFHGMEWKCLLTGAFNSFTFKLIIDRYIVIALLLFIFMIFSCFFNIFCNTYFMVVNSFRFFLSGKLFVCSSILDDSFAG